jgi:hypothetical protein
MIGLVAIIPKWTKFSGMFTLVKYYSLARYIGHIMETQWEYDGEYLSLSRDPMGTCFFFPSINQQYPLISRGYPPVNQHRP